MITKNLFAEKSTYQKWVPVLVKSHKTRLNRLVNFHLIREMLNQGVYYDSLLKKLQHLRMPGQIVWGRHDKLFTNLYLNRWRSNFPPYRVREISNSGLFPHMETPDQYTQALMAFFIQ